MDDFDFFYRDNKRPDPYPLTKVDFFRAKHRAIKQVNAAAAAKGLPPSKSVARYIDMAAIRNFDHYDDIGVLPNDPVARDLVRRKEMEAVEEKHQREVATQVIRKREAAVKDRKQALAEEVHRTEARRAEDWLQHNKAREETKQRVRESFRSQSGPGDTAAPPMHAPVIDVPSRAKKREQVVAEDNDKSNKKRVVGGKENKKAVHAWLSTSQEMPSIESDNPEISPSGGRKRRTIIDSDEEAEMSAAMETGDFED